MVQKLAASLTKPGWPGAKRLRHRESEVLAELDRWQLTGLLLGVLVLCALAFFAGVLVGKKSSPPSAPVAATSLVAPAVAAAATTPADRQRALAEVAPGTTLIDRGLARPVADPAPDDPTDAARIATHRQLQDARAAKLRQLGPMAVAAPDALSVQGGSLEGGAGPAGLGAANAPTGAGGYTLQVSAFASKSAADVVAGELRAAGHAVRIRDLSARGRPLFRVEVGQFPSLQSAQASQLKFERDSGYSGVLVPLR